MPQRQPRQRRRQHNLILVVLILVLLLPRLSRPVVIDLGCRGRHNSTRRQQTRLDGRRAQHPWSDIRCIRRRWRGEAFERVCAHKFGDGALGVDQPLEVAPDLPCCVSFKRLVSSGCVLWRQSIESVIHKGCLPLYDNTASSASRSGSSHAGGWMAVSGGFRLACVCGVQRCVSRCAGP